MKFQCLNYMWHHVVQLINHLMMPLPNRQICVSSETLQTFIQFKLKPFCDLLLDFVIDGVYTCL